MQTPLFNLIHDSIKTNGPMSVGTFMSLCLGHPQLGYYMTREAFGAQGDFTTAPEISQLFGEMVAIWVMMTWEQMGKPNNVQLIELGPGRGTLMKDIWRGIGMMPELRDHAEIHLVEFSPRLQKIQGETLQGLPVQWHMHIDSVPMEPSIIIANEFFDALPIEQAMFHDGRWHQRVVVTEDEDLIFGLGSALQGLPTENVPDGSIYEYAPQATDIMAKLCQRLQQSRGAMLVIDYGDDVHLDNRFGDTLQALHDHKMTHVFEHVGESDVTVHVAFASLKIVAQEMGCATLPVQTQREFLTQLGIRLRLEKLLPNATPEQAKQLQSGVHRLVDAAEMGDLFKVLQVFSHA